MRIPLLGTILLVSTTVEAQTFASSPTGYLAQEGTGVFRDFGNYPAARQLIADGNFRGRPMLVKEIGMRLDAGGLAVGMGTAIKFTGVTLAVPYVLRRVTFPRGRALGMLLAGAVSLATYAALSPYSFLHFDDFVEGVALQKSYHDEIRARGPQSYATIALVYARDVLPSELGAPALLAVICGLWFRRRD